MGILGKGTNRGRRAIGLVVAVAATAVLLVAAAPTSADTTGFTVTANGSTAITEGNPTPTSASFTVTLTGDGIGTPPLTPVTISVAGGAGDVTISPSQLVLDDTTPSGTVTVTAIHDNVYEPGGDETINLNFSSSDPGVGPQQASVTVADTTPPPTITIQPFSGNEGNSPQKPTFAFPVALSRPSSVPISVSCFTGSGSATSTVDFESACTGTTFQPGETGQSVAVNVIGDDQFEGDEKFPVTLYNPTGGATLGTPSTADGTIVNDDGAPQTPALSIDSYPPADSPIPENAGTATITVRLSAPAGPNGVAVIFTTTPVTATSGIDYVDFNSRVTIAPGSQTVPVPIPIVNDSLDEDSETFTVTLSVPENATIANGTRTFTIADNDANSRLDVSDASSVNEPGSGGTVNAVFNVTLSQASARTVTVPYNTVAGTASAGSDFTAKSGSLTFNPGEALSQQVSVTVLGDAVNEANETFTLALGAASGAVVGDGVGLALIVDPSAPPALTIADGAVDEGAGSITLTVTLSGAATAQTVTVDYATAVGTAGAADFTATTGTATFAPGTTTQTISIPIANDTVAEADETFTVTLSSPVGATLAKDKATVRIVDNDTGPGGTATPVGTKPPTTTTTTTTTPKPPATTTPTPVVRTLQVKLLWVKLDGKVDGKARAAIRVSLAQLVNARVVMVQGKRKITSSQFQIKRGNRTIYVVLPAFVKKGKVQLQLVMTTAQGAAKTLRTTVTLKAPVKLTAAQKAAAKKAAAKKAAAKKAAAKKAAAAKAAAA